jgi:divalent metal cation (Fe/Co/Zn/Cd) transporter
VHAHEHSHEIPSLNAAWLALASIGAKEWLYRKTMKIALQKKSSVLASNAVHHRVDSLTAIVALIAIAGSNVFPSASWLDPVGGLLVAAMVVQAGASNTRAALEELADAGIDDEVKDEVTKKVTEVGEDVVSVDGIKSGQNYLLTITVAVDPSRTILKLNETEEKVRESVVDVNGIWRVQVRFVRKGEEAMSEFVKLAKKDN